MNKVRAELLALDWKDDKFLSLGGMKGYNYLSIDKIKRNLAPVLQANGIDLGIEYCDLTQLGDANAATQHWIVTLKASLIDISTGFERIYTAFGESSDHGDKGVNKAQTAAMKQFLSNTFMLIDGVDPDADSGERTGAFTPKTPTEVLEAKSAILSNAVKPKPAVPQKPAPVIRPMAPKNVPKEENTESPAEVPEQKPVKKEPEVSGLAEPTPELSPDAISVIAAESVESLNISGPQKGAIANIIKVRTRLAQEGKLSVIEYNNMSADYAEIKDNVSGAAFLKKYNVVGKYD